jgi:hypothetical protein
VLDAAAAVAAAAVVNALQFEGDWGPAHFHLSQYLTRIVVRMLRHLFQVAPQLPGLPRSSSSPQQLLHDVRLMSDDGWQAVSANCAEHVLLKDML